MQWEVGSALNIASILVVVIVFAAMLIWVERRLLGFWQDRLGPNRVGPFGLLQVVADMIKIFTKEDWIPPFADRFGFVLAPTIIMIVILLSFSVVPFAPGVGIVDSNIGVLFVLAMASLGAYSVMLGEGNTSKVYKARSKNTGQSVALKLLREEFLNRSEGSLKAVEQEIEILKGLTHPYIIKILGYGTDGQVIKGSGREVKDMVYILLE